ncbi:MAG: hypothetical protein Unbinned92contig1004_23 [Prokaryotic dsDNA virus sp.]|nr:MAG: hypothetical protein Unbinned92contig1004_23 [Prokaryotic dsDNA virus sp.]
MTNSMKEMGKIGKEVRRRARISLKARGKVVTGNLYNSIRYEQGVSRDEKSLNLRFSFPGADYAKFVDEGVRGAMSSAKAPRSPFRFGSGSGPSGGLRPAIDKWVVKKGIAPRGAGGRFASRKGMVYAISRSIYQTGIKPSYFFTNAYDRTLKKHNAKLEKAVGEDIGNAIKTLLDGGTV